MNIRRTVLTAVLLAMCAGISASPPYSTDDPDTIPFQELDVSVLSQFVRFGDDITGILPGVEVNYGFLPGVQAHVILPAGFIYKINGRFVYGYGDTELGLKIRFIGDDSGDSFKLGSFPHAEVSTNFPGSNLGNGTLQVFVPLWLQKGWDKFTAYGGGGYWINNGNKGLNYWYFGMVLEYAFSDNADGGIEINYNTPVGEGQESNNSISAGLRMKLSDNTRLLVSVGQSVFGERAYQGYIAYQAVFNPGDSL